MVSFPVAPGARGHLFGGASAAALLKPHRALLAVSSVVLAQAFFIADGGLGAAGISLWLIGTLLNGSPLADDAVSGIDGMLWGSLAGLSGIGFTCAVCAALIALAQVRGAEGGGRAAVAA